MNPNPTYGIIGDGRVARHFQYYFDQLHIPYSSWNRHMSKPVEEVLQSCDVILVLIKDDAIEPFLQANPILQQTPCLHFSGSLVTDLAQGLHPHCNFTQSLYSLELYKNIPFVMQQGKYTFEEVFPQLPNPHFEIQPHQSPQYHALCVMCGNFPTMIWQEAARNYKNMGLPSDLFYLYIQNTATEFAQNPGTALTGPFARKDTQTIRNNEAALQGSKLQKIYSAFKKTFT